MKRMANPEVSLLEATFKIQLNSKGIRDFQRELRFDPERQWRFDFAWPGRMVAVEINGGTEYGKSRHSKGQGLRDEYEKLNNATWQGWMVFVFDAGQVNDWSACEFMERVLR